MVSPLAPRPQAVACGSQDPPRRLPTSDSATRRARIRGCQAVRVSRERGPLRCAPRQRHQTRLQAASRASHPQPRPRPHPPRDLRRPPVLADGSSKRTGLTNAEPVRQSIQFLREVQHEGGVALTASLLVPLSNYDPYRVPHRRSSAKASLRPANDPGVQRRRTSDRASEGRCSSAAFPD